MRRVALAAMLLAASCGYRLAGTADTIPKSIRTVAVPPFSNATTRYRLTDRLPSMIAREFLSRTRYEVVTSVAEADAIVQGSIINVFAFPTIIDPNTGRAAGVEMIVNMSVQMKDRRTGAVLVNLPSLSFKQRYEISTDPAAYFDESSMAFERLSVDVARTVVSSVLEGF